jgi:GTPase SAR1 family protein
MVTQRIANPYDQRTSLSNIPIKEFIILKSNLQVISWDTPGTPGNKIFFIYLASGFGVMG